MGLIEDGATDQELEEEEQRLLALSMQMTDEGIALSQARETLMSLPDQTQYMRVHKDYMRLHEEHMQVHKDLMATHAELQRRGH